MAKRNTYSGFHRAYNEGADAWTSNARKRADDERRRREEEAARREEEEEARREAARLLEEEGRAERGIGGNLVMRNRTNPLSGENRLIETLEASIGRMRNAASEYRPDGLSITQEPSYYSSRGQNPMTRVPERVQEYSSRSEDQAEYNQKYRDIVNRARSQYGDDDYAYAAQILINDRKQDDLEAEANRIRQGGGIIGNVNVANPSERLRQIEEERNRLSQRNQQLHDAYTSQQVRNTMARETMGQLSDLSRQGLNPAQNFDTGRVTQSAAERIAPLEQFYEYRDSNLAGNSFMAGLNSFNAGALRTLDKAEDILGGNAARMTVKGIAKLFGKDIDVADPTRDVADYYQGLQREYATKASYAKARSIVNEAIGMFAENLGHNLPLMALGPLGGAGAAATNTLANGTGALVTKAAQQLISNPSFLLSSMSGMGNTYNDSIASGKTELEAISDALVNGTLSAMIEVGGGIGATEAADAARGLWRNVISTAGEEAMEELWQGLVESAVTSDADTPLFSMQYGEDAIINPVNLGANMLAGAAMGGAFGGMNAIPGAISDAIARGRMDFAIASDPEVRKYILDPTNQPDIERAFGKEEAQRMVTAAAEANSVPAAKSQAGKEVQPEAMQATPDTSGNLHTSADSSRREQTNAKHEPDAKSEPYVASGRRATYAPSGEDVDLASTFTVRDGEIYFPTEDGGSMAMGDIEFPDAQTDSLYNSAANYETAEARAFVSNYTGGDVNSYARGFRAISEAAHVGNALDATVQRSIYAQSIPAPQRQAIYDAALNATETAPVAAPAAPVAMPAVEDTQMPTQTTETAQAMQEAVPAATIKGGGVIRETTGKLSHQQRVQVRGMDMLAKKYGVTIRLVDSIDVTMADGTVRRSAANGMYSGGVITVAKDAVGDGYMYVATHEMTHMVRDMGGDSYTLLEDTVLEALRNAGEDVDALISHQMDIHNAAGMTDEEFRAYCTEEVVANSIPAILTDKETVRRLVAEDRSLVQKMADFFRDLADTMAEIFEKLKGEASWKQMDALSRNRDTLREIADVFMGALEVSVENAAGAEIDAGMRYSIKSLADAAGLDVVKDKETGRISFSIDGQTVERVTADHIKNRSGLGVLVKTAVAYGNITAEDANAQYKALAEIMNMIGDTQDPEMTWAFVGASMFSAVKSNADGQYGTTVDFTTVCRKTKDMIAAMSRAMIKLGRGLTKDEVTKLQQELIAEDSPVPCPVCYVFSRWAGVGSIIDNMRKWQDKYENYTRDQLTAREEELANVLGKGKSKDLKKLLRDQDDAYSELDHQIESLRYEKRKLRTVTNKSSDASDVDKTRARDRIKEIDAALPGLTKKLNEIKSSVAPELAWLRQVRMDPGYANEGNVPRDVLFNLEDASTFAADYPLSWKYRTSRGPSAGKAILPYSDMRLGDMILGYDNNSAKGNDLFADVKGDLTESQRAAVVKAIARTKAQNLIGGQRFQSTSDFRYDYALDYLMAFLECQALGSNIQTYTKIVEFAEMVATVGGDVNLSVMPRDRGYEKVDGKNRLVFSDVTGVSYDGAKLVTDAFDNAQMILVGINDEHIRTALDETPGSDGRTIGFVIPYHASGASITEFISSLVKNLGEDFNRYNYQDYSSVQTDKDNGKATPEQKRLRDIRKKILTGKDGGKNWLPSDDELAFIRRPSADISGMSFEQLRSIELKALRGDKAAADVYLSWSGDVMWNVYRKLWVSGPQKGVRLNTQQSGSIMPHEYWNRKVDRDHAYINGFIFRSYCYSMGLVPRFSGATTGGVRYGDFTTERGYWKTLIDRPMYDRAGNYRDQQTINVTSFDQEMLKPEYAQEHWSGYAVKEPDDARAGRAADRFVEKVQSGRFSLKDTTPADTERMAALEAENASLREALDIAKSQLKLTQGHHVSDKAVASVARKLLKETQSSYDAETFAENLRQMFDHIANTDADQIAWEDIRDAGVGMAREVLSKSEALDDGVEAYVADARNYLRTTAISLSDAQKAEAAYAMGSTYNDFRRHLFGNVRISNSGISLEDAWSELSAMMPDLFPPDTVGTDMPALLLEAVDAMKPQYINPYGYDMDGAAYDLFLRMYDAYFDLPEVKTYADKQAAKYAQLKAQYARKIAEARTSARERYDARLKALRKQHTEMRQEISRKYAEAKNKADSVHKADMDRLRAQYRALSDRKNQQLLEQKAKFAEWKRSDRERRLESETVRKYRTRIEKNVKDMTDWLTRPTDSHHVPEELRRYVSEWLSGFDFSRSIERDTKKAQAWRDRLMSVRWALARAESDEDAGGFLMELDPDFLPRLDNFLAKPGTSWYIMRMDSQELAELDYMVSVLKHAITDANKLHANAIYQRIADAAEATKSDLMPMKAWKSRGPKDMFRNFFNLSQSDVFTYFDRLGPAAQSILAELRRGLDIKVDRTYQAQQFTDKAIHGLDMRRITGKDARLLTFKVAGGEIRMTKGQVMELYILNQREQARGHIYGKGIRVVDTKARDAKGHRVYTRSTDPVVVTEADVDTIIASLTQQEREVADSLRDYMSTTVSGWGNEVSMAMYGYKKFTEPAYWPIRSDENFTKTQDPEAATSGMYALRNLGMTKQTVKNANNAIMLGDAFDTFCRHIDEMTSYNAFVVPLSDAMRWFNYKGDSRSVKQDIDRVVGPEGKRYFINFVKDLNGVTEGASRGLGDALTRNAKIASVGGNIRVVIQQPTAYLRAAAVMDPKHLMAGITGAFSTKAHELAMKYAPIVRWKSWGYYDTNMGQSMRDLLIPDRETVTSWLQDKSTWLAGAMDTVTWNSLWRACESEIKSTRKDLKPGTDDFYKAVGARLSEVIDRTQVVDSVFHKSQLMRSKNGMDKMITNFMAEPTKSYNMLMSAIIKAGQSKQKWKAGKILGRAAMAYAVTAAVNAAVQSFVDALRDKEKEDKDGNARTYWDKWLDAFWGDYSSIELEELDGTRETFFRNAMAIEEGMAEALLNSNLGGNLNPLNLIPYVKDILSILQGYDAPRLDMKGITEVVSVINGLQKWMAGESKWSFAKVMVDAAGGLSYITGIPVSNIIRDVTGVYDLVAKEPIDWESETSTNARSAETLYNALMAGDRDKYNTLLPKLEADREKGIREGEAERIASDKDPAYKNDAAIISEAKHRVQNDIASLLMSNPDIALAYQYRDEGRTSDLSKVYARFKELGFQQDTITMAINQYANTIRETDPKGVRESPATYDYQSMFGAIDRGSMTDFDTIKKDIIANSDALDPDDAIKSQLTKKYKPLYTGYYDSGDAASMRKLGERLIKTGYFSQGSLDDWCMGHERDGLWQAIEDGDTYEANQRINAMRSLGRDDDGLKSSITNKWKPIYRTASASERSSIMDMLTRLDVYDSDGNRYYTRERVNKWLDE